MVRTEVQSSALLSVGYDPMVETLEVAFKTTGTVFRYWPVPQTDFDAMTAPGASAGAVFHRLVRSNPLVQSVRVEELTREEQAQEAANRG